MTADLPSGFGEVCGDRVIIALRGIVQHEDADWGHALDMTLVPRFGAR